MLWLRRSISFDFLEARRVTGRGLGSREEVCINYDGCFVALLRVFVGTSHGFALAGFNYAIGFYSGFPRRILHIVGIMWSLFSDFSVRITPTETVTLFSV